MKLKLPSAAAREPSATWRCCRSPLPTRSRCLSDADKVALIRIRKLPRRLWRICTSTVAAQPRGTVSAIDQDGAERHWTFTGSARQVETVREARWPLAAVRRRAEAFASARCSRRHIIVMPRTGRRQRHGAGHKYIYEPCMLSSEEAHPTKGRSVAGARGKFLTEDSRPSSSVVARPASRDWPVLLDLGLRCTERDAGGPMSMARSQSDFWIGTVHRGCRNKLHLRHP